VCEYTYTYMLFFFSLVYTLSSLWESEREGSNIVCFEFQKNLCVYMFECLSSFSLMKTKCSKYTLCALSTWGDDDGDHKNLFLCVFFWYYFIIEQSNIIICTQNFGCLLYIIFSLSRINFCFLIFL
jgi:hypothetical protein